MMQTAVEEKSDILVSFSVIVPVYNTEQFLPHCLDSLLQQTLPFDEIILIDDGSQDGSLGICRDYQSKHANIRVISQENRGLSCTRNRGMDECKSQYIIFLDSDDMLKENMVETLSQIVSHNSYDAILFDSEIICENDFQSIENPYDRGRYLEEGKRTGKDFLFQMFNRCYVVSAAMAAYKKEFLYKNNLFFIENICYEDNPFTVNLLLKSKNIYYSSKKLYIRRYRWGSITKSEISEKKIADSFVVLDSIIELVDELVRKNDRERYKYMALISFYYRDVCLKINQLEKNANQNIRFFNHLCVFLEKKEYFWESNIGISNIQLILNLLTVIKLPDAKDKNRKRELESRLKETLRVTAINKIRQLPVWDERGIVAIYGTGKAAEIIFKIYSRYVEIKKCKLCFLKTQANENELFEGNSVYTVKNAPQNIKYILISSQYYEDEMVNTVRKEYSKDVKIVSIFQNEIFSVDWNSIWDG